MSEILIVGDNRTALGSFRGSISMIPGPQLCGETMKACANKAGIPLDQFNSVYIGNVVQAGIGQNPAKQAALAAGFPVTTPCTLINKVCCSSIKALQLGALEIRAGDSQAVMVGGFESMSRAPHIMPNSRNGYRMGDFTVQDALIKDGLWDATYDKHMGQLVDKLNNELGITREEQDRFAIQSFDRVNEAWKNHAFDDQIVPIQTPAGEFKIDENMNKLVREKVPNLRPTFTKEGTITAANASSIADGAAAVAICSSEFAKEHNLKPIARIISFGEAGIDPSRFPLAPVGAVKNALQKANLTVNDIDLWEFNEAFASVPIMLMKDLGITEDKVNILGGACAIGHPLGCTGIRIVTALIAALKLRGLKKGCAALCNGGGGGNAVIIELL